MSSPDMSAEICGVALAHPIVNGSGTLDALTAGTLGLSAFVTKTVTVTANSSPLLGSGTGIPPWVIYIVVAVVAPHRLKRLVLRGCCGHRHSKSVTPE